jgi:hypothetical protein
MLSWTVTNRRNASFRRLRPSTATELAKEVLGDEGLKAYGSMTAFQRMGDPEEIGAAAAFLASSDSSFMTGSEIAVDGGLAQLGCRYGFDVGSPGRSVAGRSTSGFIFQDFIQFDI